MGYDISLRINTGKHMTQVYDCGNYTYNVSPMYYKAFGEGGIYSLSAMAGHTAAPFIKGAITTMRENENEYKALNPSNGFGDYEGAITYLAKILHGCEEHPEAQVFIN